MGCIDTLTKIYIYISRKKKIGKIDIYIYISRKKKVPIR